MGNQFDLRAVSKHNSRLLRARGTCFCKFLPLCCFTTFKGLKMSSYTTGIIAGQMFTLRFLNISMSFMDLSWKKDPNSLRTAAKPSVRSCVFKLGGINRWALLAQTWVFQLKDVVTCVCSRDPAWLRWSPAKLVAIISASFILFSETRSQDKEAAPFLFSALS